MTSVLRIPPHHYATLLNRNTLIESIVLGPATYTTAFDEEVIGGPVPLVVLAAGEFCVVANPVTVDDDGKPQVDEHGQPLLRHGAAEVRLGPTTFALLPGEELRERPTAQQHVAQDSALLLRARWACRDRQGKERAAGERFLFHGPATYAPLAAVEVVEVRNAIIVKENQALRLEALHDYTDRAGTARRAGEQWLVRDKGAYLPDVAERIVGIVDAFVLTADVAIHVRAVESCVDALGVRRRAGDQYLITLQDDCQAFIPSVHEKVVARVPLIALGRQQYCVVQNPLDEHGVPQFGRRQVRRGERTFFLQPGEVLVGGGVFSVVVLGPDERLAVRVLADHQDGETKRVAGARYFVHGPSEFVPTENVRMERLERARVSIDELNLHCVFQRADMSHFQRAVPVNAKLVPESQLSARKSTGRVRK